jgi:hypothetical protein
LLDSFFASLEDFLAFFLGVELTGDDDDDDQNDDDDNNDDVSES